MGGSLASTAPATVTTGTETPGGRPALRALVHEQRLNEAAGITGLRREENGTWNVVLPDGSRIQAGTIAAARHMRETLIRARGGHPLAPPLAPGAEMDTHPAHVPSTGVRPLTTRAPRNIALTDFGDAGDFLRGGHRPFVEAR